MNKKFVNLVFILTFILIFANNAYAATKVLLLPFNINAQGQTNLSSSIRDLFTTSFKKQNLSVITKNSKASSIANARSLGRSAGSDYVLFGTYSQIGESFVLEMHFVDVKSAMARPLSKRGSNLLSLSSVIDDSAQIFSRSIITKGGIQDIQVKGTVLIDPERIKNAMSSQIGDKVNAEKLDEDLQNIWALGFFDDVTTYLEPSKIGDILIVKVVEKPRINGISIQGSDEVDEKEIIGAMSLQQGNVLNEKMLLDDIEIVKELYRKKGYYLVDIKYDIKPLDMNKGVNIILNVDAGNKLYIKQVNMNGVDEDMQDQLRKIIKISEHNIFSWFTKQGILKEEDIAGDTQQIQAYLVQSGYLDAIVAEPEIIYEKDGIIVNFAISSGIRYKIGQVGFRGDLLKSTDDLYELIKLDNVKEDDEYFDLKVMQDDIQKLKDLYNEFGYAFAEVGVDTPLNKAEGIVEVYYLLEPKERVYIRNIILEGNTDTRDNVILRELRLADGQQYDGAKVRRSIERLKMLNYFKDVNVDLIPTGETGEVDMKLSVTENDTGKIGLGIGYSTYDNIGISANIQKDNLWGKGYSVGLMGYVSSKKNSMRGYFVNPRINDTNIGFSASVYSEDYEWSDFDKKSTGTELGLFYPLGEYTKLILNYRLEYYELSNVAPNASEAIKSYDGENWASVASVGIVRDTTNDYRHPTEGTKESIYLDYGGGILGGSDNFIKIRGTYGFYYALSQNHVLHARGTGIGIFKNENKTIPAFERIYIGGMTTLRGYDYEDASPRDRRTGEVIGATRAAYGSLEYIWRVSEEYSISLVPFFDYATIVDQKHDNLFDKNYYSSGLEVRWNSPLGDLRFAYGVPFTKGSAGQDLNGRFEFTMGRAF